MEPSQPNVVENISNKNSELASPKRKRQRFMDSFLNRNLSAHPSSDSMDISALSRLTSREFRNYMLLKYTMLCLNSLPSLWFTIIFDQFCGGDGGMERRRSELMARSIHEALSSEKRIICPQPLENMWKWAVNLPNPNDVRVVIIGQDPYHTVARHGDKIITMADGLAFSVNPDYARLGKPLPPTLINIMKLADKSFENRKYDDGRFLLGDKSFETHRYDDGRFHGNLSTWTESGVLLLNSALTTVQGTPNAHAHIGWNTVTDRIVEWLGGKGTNETHTKIFLLWGNEANKMRDKIDCSTHVIISSCHPSPLSAYKCGWFNRDVFQETNLLLRTLKRQPVRWSCRQELPCDVQSRLARSVRINRALSEPGPSEHQLEEALTKETEVNKHTG